MTKLVGGTPPPYLDKNLISVAALAAEIPGRPSVSTIYRWARDGRGKQQTRLQLIKVGGRLMGSVTAVHAFLAALTAEFRSEARPAANETPRSAEAIAALNQALRRRTTTAGPVPNCTPNRSANNSQKGAF